MALTQPLAKSASITHFSSMKLILHLISAMLYISTICFSQNGSITCAGENVHNNENIVNWSIGQLITEVGESEKHKIYPGMTTPKFFINYKENGKNIKTICYPNPATEYIIVEIQSNDISIFNWELYDSKGKFIKQGKSNHNNAKINIDDLHESFYVLSILDEANKLISSATLIKHK